MIALVPTVLLFLLVLGLFSSSSTVGVFAWEACSVTSTAITGLCVPQLMYDGEWIQPVTFNLYQPVTTSLTATFIESSGRVVMTPSTIELGAGNVSFSAQLNVAYLTTDSRVNLKPAFQVVFSGADATAGYFPSSFSFNLTLQPKIFCRLFPPQYVFYPGTVNFGEFNVSCDKTQDSTVTFVPPDLSANGITFSPSAGVTLVAGQLWGTFNASAVAGSLPVGSYNINFTNTGSNATRYRQLDVYVMRVRPPGRITPPPSFAHVAYRDSETFRVDLTAIPRGIVQLRIDAFRSADGSNASNVIDIKPSNVIAYNGTTRGAFRVLAREFGKFYLNFSILGADASKFQLPLVADGVAFTINSPEDGFAFDKRSSLGYLPRLRGCRVGVGRRSFHIDGQEPVEEKVCATFPKTNISSAAGDYNCTQWTTPERCQGVAQEQGWPCAWLVTSETCVAVPELENNISQVAFGSSATAFLDMNGGVLTIGRALYGQLGKYRAKENTLTRVDIPEAVKVLAGGANHFLALGGSGTLYAWGSNFRGQLGLNTKEPSMPTPQVVSFPRLEKVTCIAAGPEHSGALTLAGRAYAWGYNNRGQIAKNQNSFTTASPLAQSLRPLLIAAADLGDRVPLAINCGETHTTIATDAAVYTFGGNTHGQLGRPGVDDYKPAQPLLWNSAQPVGSAPSYPSYLLGKDCP